MVSETSPKEIILHRARGHHTEDLSAPWAMRAQTDKATVFVHPATPGATSSIFETMSSL